MHTDETERLILLFLETLEMLACNSRHVDVWHSEMVYVMNVNTARVTNVANVLIAYGEISRRHEGGRTCYRMLA